MSAAVPAVDFRNVRRLMPPVLLGPLEVIALLSFRFASLVRTAPAPTPQANKKAAAQEALLAFLQDSGVALAARHWTAPARERASRFQTLLFKRCAKSPV